MIFSTSQPKKPNKKNKKNPRDNWPCVPRASRVLELHFPANEVPLYFFKLQTERRSLSVFFPLQKIRKMCSFRSQLWRTRRIVIQNVLQAYYNRVLAVHLSLSRQTHCELLLPEKPRKTQNLLRNCWGITKIDPLLRTKGKKQKTSQKICFFFKFLPTGRLLSLDCSRGIQPFWRSAS